MSKLEESLAQVLDFASRDLNAPWPHHAPIREFHPMWCCEHPKGDHVEANPRAGHHHALCGFCTGGAAWHDYHHERDFRVDFAWPAQRVIVEVEGIRYDEQGGRHQTGSGFAKDLEKYSQLELAGWRVIRVSQREITSGMALSLIEQALKERVAVEELEARE